MFQLYYVTRLYAIVDGTFVSVARLYHWNICICGTFVSLEHLYRWYVSIGGTFVSVAHL